MRETAIFRSRHELGSNQEKEARLSRLEAFRNSPEFGRAVGAFTERHSLVPMITRRGELVEGPSTFQRALDRSDASRHDGLSAAEYLFEHAFDSAHDIPAHIKDELRFLVRGLPFKESKYDNDAVGEPIEYEVIENGVPVTKIEHAVTRIQMRPSTAQTVLPQAMRNRLKDLPTQAHFIGFYMNKTYTRLREHSAGAFERIARRYFGGDMREVELRFIPLVVKNSHIFGHDIWKVVNDFAPEGMDELPHPIGPYDVFQKMAEEVFARETVPGYGTYSSSYLPELFSGALFFQEAHLRKEGLA